MQKIALYPSTKASDSLVSKTAQMSVKPMAALQRERTNVSLNIASSPFKVITVIIPIIVI